jgi:hypothetical protein
MATSETYEKEVFGILTDDDLYLDCILFKPADVEDGQLQRLRVWVPRYPLTKASVVTCARQEVSALGSTGRVGHLVFDLRGTGDSEGQAGDLNFEADMKAIRQWASERFGQIKVGFMGTPHGREQVDVRPLRPGVVMETYHYPSSAVSQKRPLVYLATYGNFSGRDEKTCLALAKAGYPVTALDPLRYLLHAAAQERIEVPRLWQDLETFCAQLPQAPLLLGRPVAAGLALIWASGVEAVSGVLAIGRAQMAFKPRHIFANDNPHTFFLSRYVHKIAPRPVAFVLETERPLGGDREEISALLQTCDEPRRVEEVERTTLDLILELMEWLQEQGQTAE